MVFHHFPPSSFAVFHEKMQAGMAKIITKASVRLVTDNLIKIMKYFDCKEKDRILLMNIFYGLRRDLYNEPEIEIL
jgi:hypothetical protein